jgi:hypothetical protein
MLGLFRAVVERVKAVRAAREIGADAIAHVAHRKAELLELAARYEAEGRAEVAGELRAAVEHLACGPAGGVEERPRPALPARGAKRK